MTLAQDLQKATDDLIRAVCEAGEAQMKADHCRVSGEGDIFVLAQAHRSAEKAMHDKADAMQKVYVQSRLEGQVTLRSSEPSPEV